VHEGIRIPDVEVIIGAADYDVAHICFYGKDGIHQGYDVIAHINRACSRAVIRKLLQDAITAISTEEWYDVDELRVDPDKTAPPFQIT